MNELLSPDALARRRLRRTAEVLLEDSSLRGNLTDAQAQQLLSWGIALVRETALATVNESDGEAYPALGEKTAVVRRVMRLVSRLMAPPGVTSSSDQSDYLKRLLTSLQQLAGQPKNPAPLTLATWLEHNRAQLAGDAKFQLLMELIQLKVSGALDEEE